MLQRYSGIDIEATCNRIACFIGISGYSDRQLASALRTSVQSVNKWRHAHNLPDLENMFILSRIFGVSLDKMIVSVERAQSKQGFRVRDRAEEYYTFLCELLNTVDKRRDTSPNSIDSSNNHRHETKKPIFHSNSVSGYEEELFPKFIDYTQEGIHLCFCQ